MTQFGWDGWIYSQSRFEAGGFGGEANSGRIHPHAVPGTELSRNRAVLATLEFWGHEELKCSDVERSGR